MYRHLVDWLEENGYEVKNLSSPNEKTVCHMFSGKGVVGGFCEPNNDSYTNLDGRISVDHEDCFDKWSKCPLVMKLPCDMDRLKNSLDFLGSPEGYEHSNYYEYINKPMLPREED